MLTAQQRLELALPAALAWTIARSIARQSTLTEKGQARAEELLSLLAVASLEPTQDLCAADREKIKRRLDRLTYKITGHFENEPLVTLMWALHEALRILAESDGLVIIAGGTFDRAWSDLASWCFEDTETTDGQGLENAKLFDSREGIGRKLGHRLLAVFQKEGLYRRALGNLRFAA